MSRLSYTFRVLIIQAPTWRRTPRLSYLDDPDEDLQLVDVQLQVHAVRQPRSYQVHGAGVPLLRKQIHTEKTTMKGRRTRLKPDTAKKSFFPSRLGLVTFSHRLRIYLNLAPPPLLPSPRTILQPVRHQLMGILIKKGADEALGTLNHSSGPRRLSKSMKGSF